MKPAVGADNPPRAEYGLEPPARLAGGADPTAKTHNGLLELE
jgi:hypothetical protein